MANSFLIQIIHPFMLRRLTILFMSLTLCFTTVGCGSPTATTQAPSQNREFNTTTAQTPLPEGQYPVQQATYNDANGEYTLMLLNTPPGTPAVYRSTDLQMARLTDEEVKSGQKGYVKAANGQASLHIPEDFKIEYVHNVTETRPDPQTGQPQTVVVRQQSSFWAPFAGALAGQAVGSLLFTPRYYVPPVYQPGGILRGYGGYGNSYGQAVQQYQTRYQTPPPAVSNRQTLRTTGRLRSPSSSQTGTIRRVPQTGNRSSGSGYGSSTLRRSNRSTPSRANRSPSFGSGSSRSRPSRSRGGFGSRRR